MRRANAPQLSAWNALLSWASAERPPGSKWITNAARRRTGISRDDPGQVARNARVGKTTCQPPAAAVSCPDSSLSPGTLRLSVYAHVAPLQCFVTDHERTMGLWSCPSSTGAPLMFAAAE